MKKFKQSDVIYWKDDIPYWKLARHEVIKKGAMQSWNHGELQPIINSDEEIIGYRPADFSKERDFYNPINPFNYGWFLLDSGVTYYIPDICKAYEERFFMLYDTGEIFHVTGIYKKILPLCLKFEKWIGTDINTENISIAIRVPNDLLKQNKGKK